MAEASSSDSASAVLRSGTRRSRQLAAKGALEARLTEAVARVAELEGILAARDGFARVEADDCGKAEPVPLVAVGRAPYAAVGAGDAWLAPEVSDLDALGIVVDALRKVKADSKLQQEFGEDLGAQLDVLRGFVDDLVERVQKGEEKTDALLGQLFAQSLAMEQRILQISAWVNAAGGPTDAVDRIDKLEASLLLEIGKREELLTRKIEDLEAALVAQKEEQLPARAGGRQVLGDQAGLPRPRADGLAVALADGSEEREPPLPLSGGIEQVPFLSAGNAPRDTLAAVAVSAASCEGCGSTSHSLRGLVRSGGALEGAEPAGDVSVGPLVQPTPASGALAWLNEHSADESRGGPRGPGLPSDPIDRLVRTLKHQGHEHGLAEVLDETPEEVAPAAAAAAAIAAAAVTTAAAAELDRNLEATRQSRTVVVTGLHHEADEREVRDLFSIAGRVRDVRISRKAETAHVEFLMKGAALEARSLSGRKVAGQVVRVHLSPLDDSRLTHGLDMSCDGPPTDAPLRLYVGGLTGLLEHVTEKQLESIFTLFGKVESVDICRDPNADKCEGFSFVQFRSA